MKRLLSCLVIMGMLFTCVVAYAKESTGWTAQKATFKVMVRGQEYLSETPPIVVEGRTFLPLRAMGEVLGVSVKWNGQLKQAEVGMSVEEQNDSNKTVLTQAEKAIWEKSNWIATKATFKVMVRGQEFRSENPPIVVEGRTFLPLRALGNVLGVAIDWNTELRQAEVDMATVSQPEVTSVPAVPIVTPTPELDDGEDWYDDEDEEKETWISDDEDDDEDDDKDDRDDDKEASASDEDYYNDEGTSDEDYYNDEGTSDEDYYNDEGTTDEDYYNDEGTSDEDYYNDEETSD